MKFGPPDPRHRQARARARTSQLSLSLLTESARSSPILPLPILPPSALRWSIAASFSAAISYADRGASAIAASSLLNELRWSESQLGDVQGAFFAGYALTQILGGILGGRRRDDDDGAQGSALDGDRAPVEIEKGGYRAVLPISLFFTGVATLLFPLAASLGGPAWASLDRFCLGLLEGLLLPAAMAGVSATTQRAASPTPTISDDILEETKSLLGENSSEDFEDIKATSSSLVIAGCYLGSAWAYLSAWFLYSESFQRQCSEWGFVAPIWPWVFYVNGVLSMACLFFFRDEFQFGYSWGSNANVVKGDGGLSALLRDLWQETISIGKATIFSRSGRAILVAQIGQGALLYSIASWGPLYLERINQTPSNTPSPSVISDITQSETAALGASPISPTAAAASIAASALIAPQIAQAFVGASIGAAADRLSTKIGPRVARRMLQVASGVGPAIILWYLSQVDGAIVGSLSPEFLFGATQAVSALSLGAVSVSHLDIAPPAAAGAVYALGNMAAAVSGSLTVNMFGRLLEDGRGDVGHLSGASEFALPFQVVAILSAACSLIYGCTVETELEIGFNGTAADERP